MGGELGVPSPFRVDQFAEDVFACLIGDYDPMHNDPTWRFDEAWAGPIVLGFHVLSLLPRFLAERGLPARPEDGFLSLGLGRVRFVSPLPVGAEARWSVTLDGVGPHADRVLVRTSHEVRVAGSDRPAMVASHTGALFDGEPCFELPPDGAEPPPAAVAAIPGGSPVLPAPVHDEAFYEAVLARAGGWLGTTPWTAVDRRSADVFRLLVGERATLLAPVVHPFHLLSLRSYFMPQVGLPVLSDERMAAFNYGLDRVRWHAAVPAGTRLRDHVLLSSARRKQPGRYLVGTRHVVEAEGHERAVLTADCLSLFALRPRP